MTPAWVMGSNIDMTRPLMTHSQKLKEDNQNIKDKNDEKKTLSEMLKSLTTAKDTLKNITSLFASLFSGIGGTVGGTLGSSIVGGTINVASSALMRVFNDTWQFEMGGKGPGTVAEPLNDGAGKNYGVTSMTQKWTLQGFRDWLNSRYPALGTKLTGTTASAEFDESWKQLGQTNEQEFFNSQVEYTMETKLVPAVDKIYKGTGINLNNGQYSEGVFSLLLSMSNQRPAWVNEKWIPYLKSNPNATSSDIINAIGGDIAQNYSGNYANSIRNRYTQQVNNSLALTTPFTLNGNNTSITSTTGSQIIMNNSGVDISSLKLEETEEEKNKREAEEYWAKKHEEGYQSIYKSKQNEVEKGKDIAGKTNTSTTSWKQSYADDTKSNYNIGKAISNKLDSNAIKQIQQATSSSKSEVTNISSGIEEISTIDKSSITIGSSGTQSSIVVKPEELVSFIEDIKVAESNNNSQATTQTPIYFFNKDRFEGIMNELNLISDYTGEIEVTNELLEKMKESIKAKTGKSEPTKSSSSRNLNNVKAYRKYFGGAPQFAIG